jgi:excisionase family DNA binding protein
VSTARSLRAVAAPVSEEPLITLAEVAQRLGISIQTLYAFRKHGRGPRGYRIGGRVQFRWSEVDAWVQQQREPLS